MREDPATANITDRLSSTLFVAALFHGIVILGITFTASPLGDDDELPTLRITLIADGPDPEDPSQDADFLAQRSQIRSGELASGDRPTTTLAADSPISRQGDPGGVDPNDGRPRELAPGPELLLTLGVFPEQLDALPRPNEDPASANQSTAELIEGPRIATLATESSRSAR